MNCSITVLEESIKNNESLAKFYEERGEESLASAHREVLKDLREGLDKLRGETAHDKLMETLGSINEAVWQIEEHLVTIKARQ
jgi:hypothetical protein